MVSAKLTISEMKGMETAGFDPWTVAGMGSIQGPDAKEIQSIVDGIRKDGQGRLQLPKHSPDSEFCKKLKRTYRISYGVGAFSFASHSSYVLWKLKNSTDPSQLMKENLIANPYVYGGNFLASASLLYLGRLFQDTYNFECGPFPPGPSGQKSLAPETPSATPRGEGNPLHLTPKPQGGSAWEKIGWGILGAAALATAGVLLLSPFEGPLGETAMTLAAVTAFNKASPEIEPSS